MFRAFGDSISVGVGASPVANSWVALLAKALNATISNVAVSGNMVPDQTEVLYQTFPVSSDDFTVMLGTNDERIYGADAKKLTYYRDGLASMLAWLSLPNKILGKSNAVTYSGAWSSTIVHQAIGKNSNTLGSKATLKVKGTTVYLGMIRQEGVTGRFTVTIDGQLKGTYLSNGTGIKTAAGITYGPMLLRFPDLPSGEHVVVIEVVSQIGSLAKVYLDWAAGNEQPGFAKIVAVNVPFAEAYPSGGSDANVIAYNEVIAQIVTELREDGLDVNLANVNALLSPTTDMDGGYHPVNSGHLKIKNLVSSFFVGNVSFEPVTIFKGSDGHYYIGASVDAPKINIV